MSVARIPRVYEVYTSWNHRGSGWHHMFGVWCLKGPCHPRWPMMISGTSRNSPHGHIHLLVLLIGLLLLMGQCPFLLGIRLCSFNTQRTLSAASSRPRGLPLRTVLTDAVWAGLGLSGTPPVTKSGSVWRRSEENDGRWAFPVVTSR